MNNRQFKRIRQGCLLTQKQLAEQLGYAHKIRISEYERATNPVPIPPHIERAMWDMYVSDAAPELIVRQWVRNVDRRDV